MDTQTKNSLVIQVRLAASMYNVFLVSIVLLFKNKHQIVNLNVN